MPDSIPEWDSRGVIPPNSVAEPKSFDRSPYRVSVLDFVLRFGDSATRREILSGFLNFRYALRSAGVVCGFQWVDGSFLEEIERTEDRHPHDIDVVTFFHLPVGHTQISLEAENPALFDTRSTKRDFSVDAYFVHLNAAYLEQLVDVAAYWYSLWSHRRDGRWKGYVQLDLSDTDDQAARADLEPITNGGGRP